MAFPYVLIGEPVCEVSSQSSTRFEAVQPRAVVVVPGFDVVTKRQVVEIEGVKLVQGDFESVCED
jgi:hypothetical protein